MSMYIVRVHDSVLLRNSGRFRILERFSGIIDGKRRNRRLDKVGNNAGIPLKLCQKIRLHGNL